MSIPAEPVHVTERICRLANVRRFRPALQALDQAEPDIDEILATIKEPPTESADDLIDSVFESRQNVQRPETRFSPLGGWPVYYASLDWETAFDERASSVAEGVTIQLQRLTCLLRSDRCLDLRPFTDTYPYLKEGDRAAAYPPCQALAADAKRNKAEVLLTFSARRTSGTNTPTFERTALSEGAIEGRVEVLGTAR